MNKIGERSRKTAGYREKWIKWLRSQAWVDFVRGGFPQLMFRPNSQIESSMYQAELNMFETTPVV